MGEKLNEKKKFEEYWTDKKCLGTKQSFDWIKLESTSKSGIVRYFGRDWKMWQASRKATAEEIKKIIDNAKGKPTTGICWEAVWKRFMV